MKISLILFLCSVEASRFAYHVLNKALFGGELPNCLITLQRRRRTEGYFVPERFTRKDGQVTDEIALNPSVFHKQGDAETLGTLAHEMVHLWQKHFGKVGHGRYHNSRPQRQGRRQRNRRLTALP